MRIAGGAYKGRIFNPGKTFTARPTTDIAKEGLFNILTNRIDFETSKILDLFSGTGSIAYEFLSRGSSEVTIVELNPKHVKFIESVLTELNEKAIVVKADAFRYIQKCSRKFDVVFADPPYDHPKFGDIPKLILENDILNEGGVFIIEHPKSFDFSSLPNFSEIRKYGHVHFSFFQF